MSAADLDHAGRSAAGFDQRLPQPLHVGHRGLVNQSEGEQRQPDQRLETVDGAFAAVLAALGTHGDDTEVLHVLQQGTVDLLLEPQNQRQRELPCEAAVTQGVTDGEERDLFISGRYVDRYENRDGAWKFAFRSEVNDWARNDPATDDYFAATPDSLRGARKPDDAIYQRDALRTR